MSDEGKTEGKGTENSTEKKARRRRLTERLKALRERTTLLEMELNEYTNDFFRVCIFGSNRIKPNDELYQVTEELAVLLGKEGIDVLTGGGQGLMEAANKGVRRGKELSGSRSKSFGISIELGGRELPSEHLDIKHHHRKFSSRLDDFMRLSHAVIITPGGIGTLLELYFTWQLLQVGHMGDRPLILLKSNFWNGLIQWMQAEQISRGLVSPGDTRWVSIVDTPEEVMEIIRVEHEKFRERNKK